MSGGTECPVDRALPPLIWVLNLTTRPRPKPELETYPANDDASLPYKYGQRVYESFSPQTPLFTINNSHNLRTITMKFTSFTSIAATLLLSANSVLVVYSEASVPGS